MLKIKSMTEEQRELFNKVNVRMDRKKRIKVINSLLKLKVKYTSINSNRRLNKLITCLLRKDY